MSLIKQLMDIVAEFLSKFVNEHGLVYVKPLSCQFYTLADVVQCTAEVKYYSKIAWETAEKLWYKGVPIHLSYYYYPEKLRLVARIALEEVEALWRVKYSQTS